MQLKMCFILFLVGLTVQSSNEKLRPVKQNKEKREQNQTLSLFYFQCSNLRHSLNKPLSLTICNVLENLLLCRLSFSLLQQEHILILVFHNQSINKDGRN